MLGTPTVLHMGHLFEWSVERAKQLRQKVWPHGVVTGSNSSFMQRMHSVSSHRATALDLDHHALIQYQAS